MPLGDDQGQYIAKFPSTAFPGVSENEFANLALAEAIRSIEADLEAGHAAVIQIVSTGEALMERRLSEIPTEEWNDISVDVTPRETRMSP